MLSLLDTQDDKATLAQSVTFDGKVELLRRRPTLLSLTQRGAGNQSFAYRLKDSADNLHID